MSVQKRADRVFVKKGWGFEDHIVNTNYCGKLLFMEKGKKLSWHVHKIKDEVFYLQSGSVTVLFGYDEDIDKANSVNLVPGDSFHVPTGLIHRVIAHEDSEIFEFSTHHEDSDSIRLIKGD